MRKEILKAIEKELYELKTDLTNLGYDYEEVMNIIFDKVDEKIREEKLTAFQKTTKEEGITRGKIEFLIVADECEKKGWSFQKFLAVYSDLQRINAEKDGITLIKK